MNRLLLVNFDELRILWDALLRHRLALEIGDVDFSTAVALCDRVGDLMADEQFRLERRA